MNKNKQLLIVSADVLPEMIVKTLEVKKLLALGEIKSSAAACKSVGISRSAYYKYKDSVYSYDEHMTQNIVTLSAVLRDEPGVLSGVISSLHSMKANILTVNQSIPVNGVAAVTISIKLSGSSSDTLMLCAILSDLSGVVHIKLLSGS